MLNKETRRARAVRTAVHVLLALHALPAWAVDRDPLDYPLRHWLWLAGLTLAAGFVSWINKVRKGHVSPYSLTYLLGELACAMFCGMVTWAVLELANTPKLLQAALVAMAGHMGASGIALLENWAEHKLRALLGATEDADKKRRK